MATLNDEVITFYVFVDYKIYKTVNFVTFALNFHIKTQFLLKTYDSKTRIVDGVAHIFKGWMLHQYLISLHSDLWINKIKNQKSKKV